jgi:hypothetical protein
LLQKFANWDKGLLRQLAGSNILLCQHRPRWAPRTKGSHRIYPCKQVTETKGNSNPCTVIFNFIDYFILCDFPLPGAMWPFSCSDFSEFISLLCHPYLPATFSDSGLDCFLLILLLATPYRCYLYQNYLGAYLRFGKQPICITFQIFSCVLCFTY